MANNRSKNIKPEDRDKIKKPLPGLGGGAGYSPLPKKERGVDIEKKHTKIAIHTVSQFYGDNKQLSLFSDEKIDAFKDATGLNLTNRPTNYGVVLNQSQRKVLEGILKAFTDTNYKGDEEIGKDKALATLLPALSLVICDRAFCFPFSCAYGSIINAKGADCQVHPLACRF